MAAIYMSAWRALRSQELHYCLQQKVSASPTLPPSRFISVIFAALHPGTAVRQAHIVHWRGLVHQDLCLRLSELPCVGYGKPSCCLRHRESRVIVGKHVVWYHQVCLAELYTLPPFLIGDIWVTFLQHTQPALLECARLEARHRVWLQHYDAPTNFTHAARNHLKETFHDRCVGDGGGGGPWPPRSPTWPCLSSSLRVTSEVHLSIPLKLTESYNNNNAGKNKHCWTYQFSKFAVVARGTLNVHVIPTASETFSNYVICTSLKKSNLADDLFQVEFQVIEWALIIVVVRKVSANTQPSVNSLYAYQRSLTRNVTDHANSVDFFTYQL